MNKELYYKEEEIDGGQTYLSTFLILAAVEKEINY